MSVGLCRTCGFHHPREECRELSGEKFIERLIGAGWTKGDAMAEWERIKDDEEAGE